MKKQPSKKLETFANPHPDRDYEIEMECPEFTCLCPKTGQPDFAVIEIRYVPDKLCIELKSLKQYLWSYRDEGAFHEKVINDILDDLVAVCRPRWMEVEGDFNVRGGIHTTVTANYEAPPKKTRARKKK
ncbi:7-cyano-7-deazaguanine reductase [Candidatus Nitromaritima sp. SCGC AAA799-A02]|nr:7-cyano-7-deazaguanine reductase [Candidatus Nitromaritima sp. SCGC AAA799-A02]